ncbi:hypothetical protein ACHQM5_024500 [Ranunculus cassubicifolius]
MERGFLRKKTVPKQRKDNKQKPKPKINGVDRISALPKPLLHHILSFLDMKYVVQTSLLSTKWRDLWVSLRILNITCRCWVDNDEDINYEEFQNFVDKMLLHRDGSDIQKFYLTWDFIDADSVDEYMSKLYTWVACAVRRHVEEMELHIIYAPPLFSFSSSTSLRTLRLNGPALPVQAEGSWLGPALETLVIENCKHQYLEFLNISSPQLKYLMVKNDIQCEIYGPEICDLKICAPNLITLECIGYMYNDYLFENLSSVTSARIDTKMLPNTKNAKDILGTCLNKILSGLASANSLSLSVEGVQRFGELPNLWKPVPVSLPNLKYLKLREWRNNGCVHVLAKLFESFPFIQTLILERTKVPLKSSKKAVKKDVDWGRKLLFNCKFYGLKVIEMHNLQGCENELIFVESLLKNAMVLEKMTITTTKVVSSEREKELARYNKKLQSLPRASQSATISIL